MEDSIKSVRKGGSVGSVGSVGKKEVFGKVSWEREGLVEDFGGDIFRPPHRPHLPHTPHTPPKAATRRKSRGI